MKNPNPLFAPPTSLPISVKGVTASGGGVRTYRRRFGLEDVIARGEPLFGKYVYVNCEQGFHDIPKVGLRFCAICKRVCV